MAMDLETLPDAVEQLPDDAKQIWLSIFQSTFRTFSGTDQEKDEASKIAAWAAVRSKYVRDDRGKWQVKAAISFDDLYPVRGHWTRSVKFIDNMLEAKKRITYGVVYEPWVVDAQGDFASEETIEDAAHKFLKRSRKIGEQHEDWAGKGIPVESWITRTKDPDFPIPGTWVLGTQWSEEMWSKILNGEKTGYSLGGEWTRVPVVAGREFVKRVYARKSADEPIMGELDADLFEKPQHTGPRIISQIIGLDVDEVSGVDMPANRQPFKLFKSSRSAKKKATAPIANPWLKLWQNYVDAGMDEEEAREEVERVLGPAPPGTWDRKDATDDCVTAKMGDPNFQSEYPDEAQRIAVAISMCEEGKCEPSKGNVVKRNKDELDDDMDGTVQSGGTPTTVSLQDAAKQIDELIGAGNGLPIASLLQAKYPAGPDGGIALPSGMTIEQGVQWAMDTGIVPLKQAADGPAELTILKRLERTVKSIVQMLGGKAEETGTEVEAMTAEERKELDALKTQVGGIESTLGEIKSLLTGKAASTCSCHDKETPAIGEPAAKDAQGSAGEDAKGGDGAYAPTPEETGADLIELAKAVEDIVVEVKKLQSRPGVSAIPGAIAVRDTGAKAVDGDLVYSTLVGAYIPRSAREAEIKRVKDDLIRRRGNRPQNPALQMRMGK